MNRQAIEEEARWVFIKLAENIGNENSHNYYQGRIDQLAWVIRQLEKEGAR